jgi:hypothetical protein
MPRVPGRDAGLRRLVVKEQVGAAVGIHVLEMPRAVLLGAIADEADRRQIDGCRVEGVRRQDRDGDDTVRLQRDDIVGLAGLDVDSDFDLARGAEEARQREVADTPAEVGGSAGDDNLAVGLCRDVPGVVDRIAEVRGCLAAAAEAGVEGAARRVTQGDERRLSSGAGDPAGCTTAPLLVSSEAPEMSVVIVPPLPKLESREPSAL